MRFIFSIHICEHLCEEIIGIPQLMKNERKREKERREKCIMLSILYFDESFRFPPNITISFIPLLIHH